MSEIRHYTLSRSQLLFSIFSIIAAVFLLLLFGGAIAAHVDVRRWWVLPSFVSGIAIADLASGLIHWAADTWGRDDCPIIGHRLLVPFRVHHLNPDDFLRRRFVDTNGDVAFVAVPVLLGLLALPWDADWAAPVAVFGFGFCGIGMLTNQIHQWAHMPSPPALVRALQQCRLILGRIDHAAHHDRPYHVHYCITTGWWNRPLDAIDFFRRLETAITRLTGVQPREDDRRYEARYA